MTITVDTFAGLGGFTEGAEQAGLTPVMALNHNAEAVHWHSQNHDVLHVEQDLMEFDWTELPDMSDGILLASPACFGFSQNGQPAAKGTGGNARPDLDRIRIKHTKDRNTTWAVISAADSIRPAAILIENVVDFATRWSLFEPWCECLRALGYEVRTHMLDARMYGSAQHRVRAVVTAGLGFPIGLEPEYLHPEASPKRLADVLDLDFDHPDHRWQPIASKPKRTQEVIMRGAERGGIRTVMNVSQSRARYLDDFAATATTKGATQLYVVDGDHARTINPREYARIQGFPEHYKIPTNRSLASRLIGNAVDVHVSRSITSQAQAALEAA